MEQNSSGSDEPPLVSKQHIVTVKICPHNCECCFIRKHLQQHGDGRTFKEKAGICLSGKDDPLTLNVADKQRSINRTNERLLGCHFIETAARNDLLILLRGAQARLNRELEMVR